MNGLVCLLQRLLPGLRYVWQHVHPLLLLPHSGLSVALLADGQRRLDTLALRCSS